MGDAKESSGHLGMDGSGATATEMERNAMALVAGVPGLVTELVRAGL